jgi:hypothetical protein
VGEEEAHAFLAEEEGVDEPSVVRVCFLKAVQGVAEVVA